MKLCHYLICIWIFHGAAVTANAEQAARQKTFRSMGEEVNSKMKKYARSMGTKEWTYETAVGDLPCQVGSLTKLLMQLKNERSRYHQTDEQIQEKISDELADILSLIIFIADELGIDLADSWQKMLESDQKKFQQSRYSSS